MVILAMIFNSISEIRPHWHFFGDYFYFIMNLVAEKTFFNRDVKKLSDGIKSFDLSNIIFNISGVGQATRWRDFKLTLAKISFMNHDNLPFYPNNT